MDELRHYLSYVLVEYMPEPHGSLLIGILLGLRQSLPENFYNDLISTGTIHIVAASGFNISIIAKIILNTSSIFLSRKYALFVSYLGIISYTIIAGGGPAVVRAAIMGIIAYTAMFFGRQYLAVWSLFVASFAMILVDTSMLMDVGFWLSVSSTAGILLLSPDTIEGVTGLEKGLVKYGITRKNEKNESQPLMYKIVGTIKADFWTTVAAQLATLPIIIVVFGRISIISPLINVLVIWAIPYIMLLGFLKLIFGLFLDIFSYILGLLVFLPLDYMIFCIEISGNWKFNQISIDSLQLSEHPFRSTLFCIVWYLMLLIWWFSRKQKVK